jgi:hypothetical protein
MLRGAFSMPFGVLVIAAGLFWTTSAFAAIDSAGALFDTCNNPNDESKQSYCRGYVAGVSDVLTGMHIICPGARIGLDEIKNVVVKYLREHPGEQELDADDLTSTALTLAFPCK